MYPVPHIHEEAEVESRPSYEAQESPNYGLLIYWNYWS